MRPDRCQQALAEVQTRRRRCDAAALAGVDGLIARPVALVILTAYVGRQRHTAVASQGLRCWQPCHQANDSLASRHGILDGDLKLLADLHDAARFQLAPGPYERSPAQLGGVDRLDQQYLDGRAGRLLAQRGKYTRIVEYQNVARGD